MPSISLHYLCSATGRARIYDARCTGFDTLLLHFYNYSHDIYGMYLDNMICNAAVYVEIVMWHIEQSIE